MGRSAIRLAILVGITVALSTAAFASTVPSPKITATQVTFKVPVDRGSTFTLELWSNGTLLGSTHGTSGVLTVAVPVSAFCRVQADVYLTLQADVYVGPPGGHGTFYSGARATLPGCATLAGNIYLCSASGAQTTTEVAGGTLAATGPQHLPSQPSPVAPVRVPPGTYSMSAAVPPGYVFVGCGGSATVGSSGATASQPVVVPQGTAGPPTGVLDPSPPMIPAGTLGAGVGNFYVIALVPVGGGGGAAGSGAASQTDAPSGPQPALAAGHSPGSDTAALRPPSTAVGSSALAFTGMDAEPLLLAGLLALALGTLALIASRLRRRPMVAPTTTSRRRP
jgi:hypothetical protein